MGFDVVAVVEAVGGTLMEGSQYSQEALFVLETFNVFVLERGSRYCLPTWKILDQVTDTQGIAGTVELISLIARTNCGDCKSNKEVKGYVRFWDLFRLCGEDLQMFLTKLRQIVDFYEEQGIETFDILPPLFKSASIR